MAGEDPFAFVAAAEQPKPVKKHNWKGKLFSKDKGHKSTDQQVEDFLSTARPASQTQQPPRGVPAPRIDVSVSQRWPASHETSSASPDSPPSAHEIVPPPHTFRAAPKKPHRRGLKVSFSREAPDVIGEGGDECEVPTVEIYRSHKRTTSKSSIQAGSQQGYAPYVGQSRAPELRLDTGSRPDGITINEPATPEDDSPQGGPRNPLLLNTQDKDFLMALNSGQRGSRLSLRESSDPNSFARRVQAKMRAEEGRALHHRHEDPMSPDNADNTIRAQQDTLPLRPSINSQLTAEADDASLNVSLRTSPVPAVHEQPSDTPEPTLPSIPPIAPPVQVLSPPPRSALRDDLSSDYGSRPTSRDSRGKAPSPGLKMTLRSAASAVGDSAFAEFAAYAERFYPLFRLAAANFKPLLETPFPEWIRTAVWWFLRGRSRLEAAVRSRKHNLAEAARQAVVDLAKSLWINQEVIPQLAEIARYGQGGVDALLAIASTTGDQYLADTLGLHQGMMSHLRALTMSMKRNNILTAAPEQDVLDQRLDTLVWIKYPQFTPDVVAVLSGATKSMVVDRVTKVNTAEMMPLSDTPRFFTYGSMFVSAYLSSGDDDSAQYAIPCVLSIIRDRGDWYVLAAISSQNDLVNVVIQPDRKKGPTWDDVQWHVKSFSIQVRLPRGFLLDVVFEESDFKIIWNIVKYTRRIEESLQPEPGERVLFENTLKVFQYMDPGTPKAFPAEPIQRCRIRLFEKVVTLTTGTGKRDAHRGFRISVVTSPKVKTLSNVRHALGEGAPIVYGYLRGEDGSPALLLNVTEEGRTRSMLMTFHEVAERTTLHSLLIGMLPSEREFKISDIPVRSFAIEQPADAFSGQPAVSHLQFPAGAASVIDQEPGFVEHGYGPTILSEHLRAFVSTEWGSVTDRVNIGPGELKIGLDVSKSTVLNVYRPPQEDMTISLAENLVQKDYPETVTKLLQLIKSRPMVRKYDFASLQDLHTFQAALTGFRVLYDGMASTFAISRRRMVVPIYKKWEANMARIQVIQQDRTIQLLAFFADFSHGKSMNFVLKSTDTLESFGRTGKFGIRIVDAKFALPRTGDESAPYVCLDMPEYPSEHDDIDIAFDTESERTNFRSVIPATMKEPSRMKSLRR
ncbi:hypothetical protein Plec18167_004489 [Paecilomyces lecythidis]|uniref:Uncharacterized protein n=1 Tax=Paecilomyces lecythidis TaxID=3004212 RepID=A0ABR3XR06_9EURO